MFNNIVLIDTSYVFHRVTATYAWCKKAEKNFNEELIYNNFLSSINKLSKKVKVDVENMILCRDSRPIWREKFYDQYKKNRTYSQFGPHIKELYKKIEKLFNVTLRIKEAEADDIISILCFYYLELDKENHIYIISNDKDFYQLPSLFNSDRIHLINNSLKEVEINNFDLEEKIIKGDASDNIKRLNLKETKEIITANYLKNKQLIDLSYTPRYIQNRIFASGYFTPNSNNKPLAIQLGFACINTELREKEIFCSRTTRLKTIKDKGIDYVKDLITKNLRDLKILIKWNYQNGIRIMRMSSEMMPHFSNPRIERYSFDFALDELKEIGKMARLYKQRLTFHPGQFNVLSTKDEKVFQNTYNDLKWHADIMDAMGLDQDSIMVIHGGGLYGDKEKAIERFIANFRRLDKNVQRRLVLENCEKCYNVEDVLYISKEFNIPVVFDTHHYTCYNIYQKKKIIKSCDFDKGKKLKQAREYIPLILETWKRRNIKPKFHISEQRPDSRIGTHSDYIKIIPEYLLEIPEKYNMEIDIMIEAKMKEKSVFRLYQLYPQLSPF